MENLPVRTYKVTALASPFNGKRDTFHIGAYCTVEDALLEAAYRANVSPRHFAEAIVINDDVRVAKKRWHSSMPNPDAHLILKVVPGEPFSIMSLVTAVAAFSVPTASWGLAFAVGSWQALAAAAGISITGPLVSCSRCPKN